MLSRVAENLFWIGRYVERAENIARLVDAARRMVLLPKELGREVSNEWASMLIAAGSGAILKEEPEAANADTAINELIFSHTNPSSVYTCLNVARENAKSVRFALTQECWEALNSAWSEMRALERSSAPMEGLADLIDWVKSKAAIFRGAVYGTMLRDDGYLFLRMGMAVERIDSTARLIDVKYHVLLPSLSDIGSAADHYQWLSLLQAVSAQRAYFFTTKNEVTPRGVVDFLVLNQAFPRSVLFNLRRAEEAVLELEGMYDQKSDCRASLTWLAERLAGLDVETIFDFGLHEFLTDIVQQNYDIANLLGDAYGFTPPISEAESVNERSIQSQ